MWRRVARRTPRARPRLGRNHGSRSRLRRLATGHVLPRVHNQHPAWDVSCSPPSPVSLQSASGCQPSGRQPAVPTPRPAVCTHCARCPDKDNSCLGAALPVWVPGLCAAFRACQRKENLPRISWGVAGATAGGGGVRGVVFPCQRCLTVSCLTFCAFFSRAIVKPAP